MDPVSHSDFTKLSFGIYSPSEIRKLSHFEVTNPDTFDALDHPTFGGLHDLRFGPSNQMEGCETCGLRASWCPGHYAHITLPLPVYNPFLLKSLYQLLRGTCFNCSQLLAPPVAKLLVLYQLKALDYGLITTVQELSEAAFMDTSVSDSAGGADVLFTNEAKMKKILNDAIKGQNLNKLKDSAKVKNVVEERQSLVKEFIRKYLMQGMKRKCPHCQAPKDKISLTGDHKLVINAKSSGKIEVNFPPDSQGNEEESNSSSMILTPRRVSEILRSLWEKEKGVLEWIFVALRVNKVSTSAPDEVPIDMFFISVLLVPPARFRPISVVKDNKYLNPTTTGYQNILTDCVQIRSVLKKIDGKTLEAAEQQTVNSLPGDTDTEKFSRLWNLLQNDVNCLFDSTMNNARKGKFIGVKQILEKKEGLFRKKIMGKRVNFAARSVISPDPYIMIDEIGVPEVFAKYLTYPVPVTPFNVEDLRQAVINGPAVYPGAEKIHSPNGQVNLLKAEDHLQRNMHACMLETPVPSAKKQGVPKVVHRHMVDGDIVLLNRQPTLHKPSIMAHKVRILKHEKTLRLHYANCKAYNADFDGDEMNMHFPQGELAKAEGRFIATVNNQYLVPRDGTPLTSLIQDHVIGAVQLTMRGKFFSREHYQNLVYNSLPLRLGYSSLPLERQEIKLLPPAILKPEPMWSGKQVFSTVMMNVLPQGQGLPFIESKAKVSVKNWQKEPAREWLAGGTPLVGESMSESEVIIHDGELLCGVIDKGSIGTTSYGLIHCCYEVYGGEVSNGLLSALSRLFTIYMQVKLAFTMDIADFMLDEDADRKRRKVLRKSEKVGDGVVSDAFDVECTDTDELKHQYRKAHQSPSDTGLKTLDYYMKKRTDAVNNDINNICIPKGLVKKFPSNNLQLMVQSGAKGALVNAMQISCLLGQIELEGQRVPLMVDGSSLPMCLPYDSSPSAGGFVGSRFFTGIIQPENFYHSMAGREGLIDTAVKTSRSGYLQRCLIKNLESLSVNYDLTVRDSDGSVIQFLYGEDGLDILNVQMLKEAGLDLLAKNQKAIMAKVSKEHLERDTAITNHKEKVSKWLNKHRWLKKSDRRSPFLRFMKKGVELDPEMPEEKNALEIINKWFLLDNQSKKRIAKHVKKCPDPVTSIHRPDLSFSSVSEKLEQLIEEYIQKRQSRSNTSNTSEQLSPEEFRNMCYYEAFKGLASPGESVGVLAAQSVGEPSTQMTLNTFHFAGRGEMNITLGIPRLREILMVASASIATPTMDLPLLVIPGIEKKAEKLKIKLSSVHLKEVLKSVEIKESLVVKGCTRRFRNYKIRMEFQPHELYRGIYHVTPLSVLDYIEQSFILRLEKHAKKRLAKTTCAPLITVEKVKKLDVPVFAENEGEDVSSGFDDPDADRMSGAEDGDTMIANSRIKQKNDREYEEPEEVEQFAEQGDSDDEAEDLKVELQSDNEDATVGETRNTHTRHNKSAITDEMKARRIKGVISRCACVSHYDFDSEDLSWCEFMLQFTIENSKLDMQTVVNNEVEKCYVYRVPDIRKAVVASMPSGEMMLKTEGVNFLEIFGVDYVKYIDTSRVYSNDIHAIARTFGIEAARLAIIKEIKLVFATYGIEVDPRHLLLIADYMTFDGTYKPCNRFGMGNCPSPIQQMTFETTMNFLQTAVLHGYSDSLKSPSAKLTVGKPVMLGTGIVDRVFVRLGYAKGAKEEAAKHLAEMPSLKQEFRKRREAEQDDALDDST